MANFRSKMQWLFFSGFWHEIYTSLTEDNDHMWSPIWSLKKKNELRVRTGLNKFIFTGHWTCNFSTSVSFSISRTHWLLRMLWLCGYGSEALSIEAGRPAAWSIISPDYHPPHTLIRSQLEQDRGAECQHSTENQNRPVCTYACVCVATQTLANMNVLLKTTNRLGGNGNTSDGKYKVQRNTCCLCVCETVLLQTTMPWVICSSR